MVNGIGHGQSYQAAFARFGGGVRGAEAAGKQDWKAEGAHDHGHHQGRAHGVLRNLLAGHYQGMAQSRLSINFSAEIQTLVAQEEESATSAAAAGFKEQATAIVNEFLDGLEDGEFDFDAVNAAAEEFFAAVDELGQSASTLEELEAGLADAVDAFGSALNGAIAVSPPTETTDPTGTGEVAGTDDSVAGIAFSDTEPLAAAEISDPAPSDAVDDASSVGDPTEVSPPEDPFAELTKLIEDLTDSLIELAQSILSDAGATLSSFKLSFEASVVTASSSTASASYSEVSLSLDASATESSGFELAA